MATSEDAAHLAASLRNDPQQEQEWLRQSNLTYGGLIGIGVVMIQPFLTAESLDTPARICVAAFSLAIPMLAALVMLNQQEAFRHRAAESRVVGVATAGAQLCAFVGVVAAFWHILWFAGVGILVGSVIGLTAYSAGYTRLEVPGSK